jgi:DNA-3-methyladenine glycosylase II
VTKPFVREHFKKVDPTLFGVIQAMEAAQLEPIEVVAKSSEMFFVNLCESIVGQQLSEKAGDTIWRRFTALFAQQPITPQTLLALPDEVIRNAGTSNSKVRYLKNWAESVTTGLVELNKLNEMTEKEIINTLTQVKGIGRWTAEMFLMFSLGREDVFSHGDLGLRNAIKRWYPKLGPDFTKDAIEELCLKWSPYRTYASKVLWRSLSLPKSKT